MKCKTCLLYHSSADFLFFFGKRMGMENEVLVLPQVSLLEFYCYQLEFHEWMGTIGSRWGKKKTTN